MSRRIVRRPWHRRRASHWKTRASLRSVLETLPSFIVQLDSDRRLRYVNRLRSSVTLDQVIGRPVREFAAPDDLETFEKAVDDALRTGGDADLPDARVAPCRGAGPAYYQGYAVPIEDTNGQPGLTLLATDVTEHVPRAEALEESRERLRVAAKATGVGLWTLDVATNQLDWDRGMVEIAERNVASPKMYVDEVVHPEDRELLAASVDAGREQAGEVLPGLFGDGANA